MHVYMVIVNFVGFCYPGIIFILMTCSFYYLHSSLNSRDKLITGMVEQKTWEEKNHGFIQV